MGSTASKPLIKVKIGRSNPAAQGIYALYGLKDNIFPYTITLTRKVSDRVMLDTKLEEINKEISRNLNRLSINNQNAFVSSKIDPHCLAKNLVTNGKKIEPVYYNLSEHGDHFILCKESIFEINDRIGDLRNLVLLQLCCNYITKIPPSIINLQKLTTLSLARNQLRYIPEEVCELKNLSHLDLSFNFLTELPQNLKNLESLNSLHLENNAFTKMPVSISKLKSLRTLIFTNNLIQDIPLQILRMPFLIDFNASTSTLVYDNVFKEVGKLDLVEICSRNIIRNTLPVYKSIDRSTIERLLNVEECGFCGGPIFDAYYLIKTSDWFETQIYPVKYKTCKKHFKDQKNRIGALFAKSHGTIPYNLLVRHNLSIKDIFNPSVSQKKRHKFKQLFSPKMHLWNLAKFNNPEIRRDFFRKVDHFFYN